MRSPITADYAIRDGGWIATAREHQVVAYGRTLEKARQNLVVALAKALRSYPGSVAVIDAIGINAAARASVASAHAARTAALAAEAEAARATLLAARNLQKAGLSLRDIAYLLGISHARVHQLIQKEKSK